MSKHSILTASGLGRSFTGFSQVLTQGLPKQVITCTEEGQVVKLRPDRYTIIDANYYQTVVLSMEQPLDSRVTVCLCEVRHAYTILTDDSIKFKRADESPFGTRPDYILVGQVLDGMLFVMDIRDPFTPTLTINGTTSTTFKSVPYGYTFSPYLFGQALDEDVTVTADGASLSYGDSTNVQSLVIPKERFKDGIVDIKVYMLAVALASASATVTVSSGSLSYSTTFMLSYTGGGGIIIPKN